MKQNGSPVGEVIVYNHGNNAHREYWYLCNKAKAGFQPYTWPSSTNTNVTTQYVFKSGSPPGSWDPGNPADYEPPFYPNVTFIDCDCSV